MARPVERGLLTELSDAMRDASICGLGQAAPNPLLSVFKYFPEDLARPLKLSVEFHDQNDGQSEVDQVQPRRP